MEQIATGKVFRSQKIINALEHTSLQDQGRKQAQSPTGCLYRIIEYPEMKWAHRGVVMKKKKIRKYCIRISL